eukprot:1121096-Pyramimonas_sp.AAC.1
MDGGEFVVLSWNANGMEEGKTRDAADVLDTDTDSGTRWDVLLYQEGPFAEGSTEKCLESGPPWCCSPASAATRRRVGIVLNPRWASRRAAA